MGWPSVSDVKELPNNTLSWITSVAQKRLATLWKKAENGSNNIEKVITDENRKIKNGEINFLQNYEMNAQEQPKTSMQFGQKPFHQQFYDASEMNEMQLQQFHSATTEITQPCSSTHTFELPQNQYPFSQTYSIHSSFPSSKPQKQQILKIEQKSLPNAMSTENKIRAEIRKPSQYNFQLQPLPSLPLAIEHHPKEDNVEMYEEAYHFYDNVMKAILFCLKFESTIFSLHEKKQLFDLKMKKNLKDNEKKWYVLFCFNKISIILHFFLFEEIENLRNEERFKSNLLKMAQSNTHLASKNQILPSRTSPMPMPMPSYNTANFANDLTAILKKDRKLSSQMLEPPTKSNSKDSQKAATPKTNTKDLLPKILISSDKFRDAEKSYSNNNLDMPIENIPKDSKIKVGVMGLSGAGKSYLIASLINIPFQKIGNTKSVEYGDNCIFFEIDHPNYGFVSNQPEAIKLKCQENFDQIQINNLTCLLNVISGDLREEDIFATQLALHAGIPVVIIRSKSDEWLDGSFPNNITEVNKQTFIEKDKKYVQTIAANIDEAVAKCPIFNISALSIYNISTKTKRASQMKKYLIDELALIQYLEKNGIRFDSLKNDISEVLDGAILESYNSYSLFLTEQSATEASKNEDTNEKVDILFVGRIGAGKSAIIDALRGIKENDKNSATKIKSCLIQNSKAAEFSYQEPTAFSHIIDQLKQFNLHELKQIYLVIGDTVGEIDAKIVKFAVDENLPLTILLTKTDLHIDNIMERQGFERKDLKNYYNQRMKVTKIEICKLAQNATAKINIFVISSPVVRNLITNTDKFLQYACDENSFLSNFAKIV